MDGESEPTMTRRALLSGVSAGLAAESPVGAAAAALRDQSQYALVMGDGCAPIRPIRGESPVEAFYEYQLPAERTSDVNGAVTGDAAEYASAGTADLQRGRTSIAFLYQGPKGLSLVVVHGSLGTEDSGAVTFQLSGLPDDGSWVVKDDRYRNSETGEIASTNYDTWNVEGETHQIDWTWGASGTDGGAFRGLGDDFAVTIDPAFNEAAALYGDHFDGTITDWQFLSGSAGDVERVHLDLDQEITIRTGDCDDGDQAASPR